MTTMIRIDNGVILERLGAVLIRYVLVNCFTVGRLLKIYSL
jgi:hypothetical protein